MLARIRLPFSWVPVYTHKNQGNVFCPSARLTKIRRMFMVPQLGSRIRIMSSVL